MIVAVLLTKNERELITWKYLLAGTVLTSTAFTIASVFSNATSYPFNLYWSDGNRLWDYSIMFGRDIYNYPSDQPINAFITSGRQFLWGLPFLLPNTTILFNRCWSAFVMSIPYMILGWIAFKTKESKFWEVLLLGFWAFLFLNQGPIYTPLILSAILVALIWERPLWIALPAIAFAGYYAAITRYTWEFAPAIWAGMLFLNGRKLKGERLGLREWGSAIALAVAGVSVWYLSPILQQAWENHTNPISGLGNAVAGTVAGVQSATSRQPLLWSRLLPNETYPEGILGGLLIAILPLAILLFYLLKTKYWQPTLWQKLTIAGALLPFLVVGLIISTKIGGGNNLHNLDMFLIALVFVSAIAWRNGSREWFIRQQDFPLWTKILLVVLIALPALPFLRGLHPNISLTEAEITQVKILADTNHVETLPSESDINDALWYIHHAINDAEERGGEILFIDARQLLTFNYVPQVPLVPEYEKKRMMDEAMGSDAAYFAPYYQDLAKHRFSLIISEPLKVPDQEEGAFSEEGDAWTKWVAAPTLCYYEPLETLRNVYIQLLVPRQEALDCSPYLP